MRKRLLRYLSALLVSVISTYSGMQRYALADAVDEQGCGLSDVAAWQVLLEDPQEEATPAYRQSVTEAFLKACPERPEAGSAHEIAGMAAAWAGNVDDAARHFEAMGYTTDSETLLMHAAVRFALGEDTYALKLRDEAIEHWMSRLVRYGLADVGIEETPQGELIRVRFLETNPETQVSYLWIAKPKAAAWPAALSITSERQLNALFRLRAGDEAEALRHVRLYRCRARKVLARTNEPIKEADMDAAAMAGLRAYMADPDRPEAGALNACLFDGQILPEISRTKAIPVQ
ncbi:MAG: hypothetical protein RIB03_08690 [Henriciella sp.]|uniref:hypothetical protein n=1 Tax=Henriciella sp. TaxID=1968823 RepID=UPI0032EEC261